LPALSLQKQFSGVRQVHVFKDALYLRFDEIKSQIQSIFKNMNLSHTGELLMDSNEPPERLSGPERD
jgi:hypothetical protein